MNKNFLVRYLILSEARTEQEKDRLANLMAYGNDPTKMAFRAAQRTPTPPPREIDRFDECTQKFFLSYEIIYDNDCSGT